MRTALVSVGALLGLAWAFGRRRFRLPVDAPVSSPFGPRVHPITGEVHDHNGVDFSAPVGTHVYAPADGVVLSDFWTDRGGRQLVIDHDGYRTGYAHLGTVVVGEGDVVNRGDLIAYSGRSGMVTGPHLHYTLRTPDGIYVDPLNYA